jgi:glycosyltransferase involved in cell wall biosynthesis
VIQIEGLEMVRHGLAAVAAARAAGQQPRVAYDAHNAEWVLQDRAWRADVGRPAGWIGAFYSRLQTAKLRRFERALLGAVDATIAVSDADAAALRAVEGHPRGSRRARIEVVPNGVDVDAVEAADPAAVEAGTCLFIGKMDFRPNVDAMSWMAREAWPLIRAEVPEARLWIVGRDPNAVVTALADGSNGIEVVGGVPEVSTWLARAAVVVVPLRIGGGTRLKVLEAMSAGKAIAATTMAVEGLHLTHEREALLGDRPAEFAHCVVQLLRDAAQRGRLGAQARHRVERDYRWSALVPRIEALYANRENRP